MNDIEVLEELIEYLERNDVQDIMCDTTPEIQAIENLLKERQSDKEKIKDLERKLKIKDEYMELIRDILYDYDGYYDEETKKGSIEGLASLVDLTIEYLGYSLKANDKKEMYQNAKGEKLNILFEELLNKNVK